MRASSVTAIVAVLVVLLASLPAGLSGQSPRGATLLVTKTDGSQIAGELIAAKPEGLLLLDGRGLDVSVPIADIQAVRIIRRSKAFPSLLIGTAAGAVGGFLALYKVTEGEYGEHDLLVPATLSIAGAAGLIGFVVGALAGKDITFTVAGRSKAEVDRFWERLRTSSREGRREAWAAPRRRPGLGLTIAMSPTAAIASTSLSQDGTFRFPDEPSPESGPYPSPFYSESPAGHEKPLEVTRLGPFCLTYDWKKNWLLELDVFSYGGGSGAVFGNLRFTSSRNGETYFSVYSAVYQPRFLDLLAGLAYRSPISGTADRQALEIGLAAGPSFVSLEKRINYVQGLVRLRRTAFCARARAAWDYRISPTFSLGIFAEYRLVRTSALASTDLVDLEFGPEGILGEGTVRSTEVSAPGFPLEGSRLYCGFRSGFRF